MQTKIIYPSLQKYFPYKPINFPYEPINFPYKGFVGKRIKSLALTSIVEVNVNA
jgi:hypothetical protein